MKAIISNRIFLKPKDDAHLKELIKALTYRIEQKTTGKPTNYGSMNRVEIIRNYKALPGGVISIPQGRFDLIPEDYEIVDKRVLNEDYFPDPEFPLRDSQQPIYDAVNDTCIINALVGWGKTFCALWLAYKLKQKTLVITHTTALRDQWIDEVKKLFGFTPGIIGSGKYDLDAPIVVGNVQTITKYKLELSKEFGTLILDEMHHCPATTFAGIVDSSHARYRIGLSGTLQRKDGKHIVFRDYFGENIFKPPQSHTMNPTVKIIKSGIHLTGTNWAQKLNNLLYDEDYQMFIATIAKLQIQKGHKVLIAASRVEFLRKVKEHLGEDCVLITGEETDFEKRKALLEKIESGEASSIAGSRQIFTEGISVNPLSCVILGDPTSNESVLEQLIGRIQRLYPGKLQPLVVDINFASPSERKQNAMRYAFYVGKGWTIET